MVRFLSLMFVLALIISVDAKPTRPPIPPKDAAPKQKTHPMPKLSSQTNWGDYIALGPKQFQLDNHPIWGGIGTVRDDGKVFILWTLRATDEACPGVYTVDADGSLTGVWGYGHDTKIEANGELTGNVRPDRVYNLPVEEPPGL